MDTYVVINTIMMGILVAILTILAICELMK